MSHLVSDLLTALAGGVLIGLAAGLFMLLRGRIMGVSGIVARFYQSTDNALLLLGMPLGLGLYLLAKQGDAAISLTHSPVLLIAGGLLVGFGSRLGNGCTSGHAVCGLARLSPRSLIATGLFMVAAMITVALEKL